MKKIYILGAGGMAREAYLILKNLGKDKLVKAFVVENLSEKKHYLDKPIINADVLSNVNKKRVKLIGAIGSPLRRRWIEDLESKGFSFITLIDASVRMNKTISIGAGSLVCAGSVLTCDIKIGRHSIVNVGSSISHDSVIGNFVSLSPGVHLAGRVKIEDGAWLGIGANIIQDIVVGKRAFIAAGALVTRNVPKNTLVMGVPARPVRLLAERDWKKLI